MAIPNVILNSVRHAPRSEQTFRILAMLSITLAGFAVNATGADWSTPEQQLARRIVAVTGSGSVSVSFENRSSLGRRDAEIIQNGLRNTLETVGVRFAKPEQAAAAVKITLSENLNSYVWVAEVQRAGGSEPVVAMVSAARPERAVGTPDSVPLSLRKISLWSQVDAILDVAVLEESSGPTYIAVLNPEKVSLYRFQGGRWQEEQSARIIHSQAWPRDLRGRLILSKDHLLDVYLPGVVCRGSGSMPLAVNCSESDDPWPLTVSALTAGSQDSNPLNVRAFFASTRNFFTGALTPAIGKFNSAPKFFSAAVVSRDKSQLWLFGAADGFIHLLDGATDQPLRLSWGSDLTSIKTTCGAGWQVLATSSGQESGDSLRAYEIPDRDPVPVSAPVEFPGAITALWTESKGDTAVAVAKNPATGNYEAFRLAVACNQ